ncbi:techylectin-5B-like [Acanthaster planci]|uniref:Techylectin-5B-like n=1 Tax=Acanthaster planci TaxID=133434 RepID=A0A8B7ZR53_ACAPL|nr:techylectin-5B-like [Acanthaster planci]
METQSIPTLFLRVALLLCLVCVISSLSVQKNPCSAVRHFAFHGAANRALKNFELHESVGGRRVVCGINCHADPRCKSFNFYEWDGTCVLNNASREAHPEDFVKTPGSVYYDADEGTALLSCSSCKQLRDAGYRTSGVYTIYPAAFSDGLEVFCDMEADGGGWVVIQRRQDGSEDFDRPWKDYAAGFGNLSGEFWLGNTVLQALTSAPGGSWKMRFDMEDWMGGKVWAEYSGVRLSGDQYTLTFNAFNVASTAGDSLANNYKFSTKDQDNDLYSPANCVFIQGGAWWHTACGSSSLNGPYLQPSDTEGGRGIYWYTFKNAYYSLKTCTMKISETR